ncbi:HNH endonuclease [Priestia megaterium]|uniref:HNH endonuclease signature motif containing protein n=1 Tax=Priestia megaterium TaxID=1404 RepID=UPI0039C1A75A
MFKKFFYMSLIVLLFLVSIFSFTGVSLAAENVASPDGYKVVDKKVNHVTENIYLEYKKDGQTKTITKQEFKNAEAKAKEEYNKHRQNKIYNTSKKATLSPNNINKKIKSPQATAASYLEVNTSATFDSNKKNITLTATINKIIGTPPIIIITGYNLYSNKAVLGGFNKVAGLQKEWTGSQIKVGQQTSKVYNVTSTNFWMTSSVITAGWAGGNPKTDTAQSGPVLTNKKAQFYPNIYTEFMKKSMPIPERADMKAVPIEKRVPWNNTLRGQYIKKFIDTYGDPKWDWSTADIHHVVPREYGGTNNFSNLYPLTRELHQQVVSPWWVNY